MTTLATIRTKVRRLTASPSAVQLTDAQIDDYVNTYYLHDMPADIKVFDLKEMYTFYTSPNIDTYALNVNPSFTAVAPRAYFSVEPPAYCGGKLMFYSQSEAEFYGHYPAYTSEDEQAGDGTAGAYAITVTNIPVLRNNVTVSATDAGGNRLIAWDDGAGTFGGDAVGTINYITGVIAITFTGNIPVTENITVHTVPYVTAQPMSMLFKDDVFTVRPVPDKTYRIDISTYVYPTVLLNAGDSPETQSMWQLLAIGASRKVLEDRGDMQSREQLTPLFEEQLTLVKRRTVAQNRPARAATIYAGQVEHGSIF